MLFNREKICSSAYSEDQRCQILFYSEAIGGNGEEIARTSGSCHEDLTHGRSALALAYCTIPKIELAARTIGTITPQHNMAGHRQSINIQHADNLLLISAPFKRSVGSIWFVRAIANTNHTLPMERSNGAGINSTCQVIWRSRGRSRVFVEGGFDLCLSGLCV